ncbi:hypothetical protein PGB90_000909 [Kerria lacca]
MSNKCLLIPSGFPRLPLKNGIGRVVCQLKRITIKFCKSSGSSQGVRNFIELDLLDFTNNNPEVVIYLKPRRHHSPVVISEYLNGERHYMNFHNFTRDNTNKWLNFLRTRVGIKTIRFRKLQHTELPSIQGVWSPFTNKSPELNITSFPNEKFLQPKHLPESATERLRKMFERQKLKESEEMKMNNKSIEVQQ